MKVELLPALTDNYMYLVIDEGTKEAAIVDPVQPQKVGRPPEGLCRAGEPVQTWVHPLSFGWPGRGWSEPRLPSLGRRTTRAGLLEPGPGVLRGLCPVWLQVLDTVKERGVKLTTVLTTHHHW